MCKKLTDNWLAMTRCRPLLTRTPRRLDLWTVEEETATIDVKDIEGFCCCFLLPSWNISKYQFARIETKEGMCFTANHTVTVEIWV